MKKFWDEFSNPGVKYTQSPFWFLNGKVDGDEYVAQTDEMAKQGVLQSMPHPRFGMDRREYLTENYFGAIRKLVENADEKGYLVNLYDEYNWSSGPAGGKITVQREFCALGISIVSGRTLTGEWISESMASGFRNWGEVEEVLFAGYVKYSSQETICFNEIVRSEYEFDGDKVKIVLPKGDYTVFAIYTVRTVHPSPLRQGNGGIANYLNPEMTDKFIELTHKEYYKHMPELFGNTIQSIFYDEVAPYSSGNFTWTNGFEKTFYEYKGYDLIEKLPMLFFDGDDLVYKVRYDYFDVMTKVYSDGFVGKLADWCEKHDIALTGHTHEEPIQWTLTGDVFRALEKQQWVGLDSLVGYKSYSDLKLAISAAHTENKEIVLCEALGCLNGWECSLRDAKKAYNQLAVAGCNLLVPHAFFQTSDNPKVECPPSFFIENPYWDFYHNLSKMTDIQCFVNRETKHLCDVAVFYPIASWWANSRDGRGKGFPWEINGENRVRYQKLSASFVNSIDELVHNQIDCDVVGSKALRDGEPTNGCMRLYSESYKGIVVTTEKVVSIEDMKNILKYAENGVKIFAEKGFSPTACVENSDDLCSVLDKLFPYLIYFEDTNELATVIRKNIVSDIEILDGQEKYFDISHRRKDNTDIYLVSNTDENRRKVKVNFNAIRKNIAVLDMYGCKERFKFTVENKTEVEFCCEAETLYYVVLSDDEIVSNVEKKSIPDSEKIDFSDGFTFIPKTGGEIAVPVFKTTFKHYEGGAEGEKVFWKTWFLPEFDDSNWETSNVKRDEKTFIDHGSHFFRFEIPRGAVALKKPLPMNCEYALYINGKEIETIIDFATQNEEWLYFDDCRNCSGVLAIECSAMSPNYGLIGSPVFKIEPVIADFTDWNEQGLGWFSGFGVYEKSFEVENILNEEFWLDLGDVRECAEVFVNDKSVAQLIWGPYYVEISEFLKKGKNTIRIEVCNLISNEFSWDNIGSRGGGRRLKSGLFEVKCISK